MPTYKYTRNASNGAPEYIHLLGKTLYNGDTIATNCYLDSDILGSFDSLALTADTPYISPIVVTTGAVTAGTTLVVPDVHWNFDIHVNTGAGVGVKVTFNGDTSNVIYVAPASNTIIARSVSGRAIRTITITLDGSGTYSLYCIRIEQAAYSDNYGI
jgi:hypothetical protein